MRITVVSLALLGAFSIAYAWSLPRTVIIERTPAGFEPREVTVRPGDVIVFRATHGKAFWPASDAHPSHRILTTFDSKAPIEPAATWIYTAEFPGSWPYHDHLAPSARGRIHVRGPERSLEDCTDDYEGSTTKAFCWGQELSRIIKKDGLAAALTSAEAANTSPEFGAWCHDVMHIVGAAAYDAYASDPTEVYAHPMTIACGYGFYHGFIETMMLELGANNVGAARTYCDSIYESTALPTYSARARAVNACYHGVGHALFDIVDSSLWGDPRAMVDLVTAQCERFTDDQHGREVCMSGVYNSLANAHSSRSYELGYTDDTDRFCYDEKPGYQPRCFIELSLGMTRDRQDTFAETLVHMRTLPLDVQEAVLIGLYDDEYRHMFDNPSLEDGRALCETARDELEARACIAGITHSVKYRSARSPEVIADDLFNLCALFAGQERRYCLNQAYYNLNSFYERPAMIERCARTFEETACQDAV